MSLIITRVVNGSTPNEENIWLKAEAKMNTKGYAIVDRTFDKDGNVSNEFRHIYILPPLDVEKDEFILIQIGEGKNGKRKFGDVNQHYHNLYWGSDHCILNNNGNDTISLIKYSVIDSKKVL